MRVLVMGAGRMGAIRVEDLASDSRVTEVLVTNRSAERAAELAAQWGATTVPWDAASTAGADAIVVTVGTDAHEAALLTVLPLGLPVLCEKPIAMTLGQTESVIALAQTSGSRLQIGFQRRFDDSIRAVHDRISRGQIGTLYSLTLTARDIFPSPREFIAGSGGIFRDLHVHDFDLVRWLTGDDIDTVFATTAVREHMDYRDFDDADVSSVIAVTSSGVQVIIGGARHDARGHDVRLEAFGSKDSVAAGLNSRTPLRTIENDLPFSADPYHGFVDRFRDAFRHETHSFISFALGEIDNPCPPDSALESLRVAIACEQSVASRVAVRVADVV